jgi:hypothetical protein
VTYRDRQRLSDIQAAIDAIRSHLQRGTLTAHAILQATVDDDLPELERAIHIMAASLPDDDGDAYTR